MELEEGMRKDVGWKKGRKKKQNSKRQKQERSTRKGDKNKN